MKKWDDSVFLRHILDSIAIIESYLSEITENTFKETSLLQDGVIRQLQIIGEATKKISPDIRSKYPDIPWQNIAGMRDKLVHDYFGVDVDAVWITVKNDLPPLISRISEILNEIRQ
jgi:uncharacterized protein with HEPN domain